MAAVDPLLELRVDVHRHLRVGVADLAHHPLDVEVVGEQRDRDVGAAQRGRIADPIEVFADALSALEEGDRIFSETLRRQLEEGSLFVEEEEEMPGGGTPLPG